MKKIFTILTIWLLTGAAVASAQSLSFTSPDQDNFGEADQTNIDVQNYVVYEHTDDKEISFGWSWAGNVPEGWEIGLCTDELCFFSDVSTLPTMLAPGDSTKIKVQFKPNGIEGDAQITFQFYKLSDPTLTISSTFSASANPVSVEEISLEPTFNIFPNPAVNNLTIELTNFEDASFAKIYNLVGQEVKLIELDSYTDFRSKINVADLREGMYLLTIEDFSGNLLDTRRFSKVN